MLTDFFLSINNSQNLSQLEGMLDKEIKVGMSGLSMLVSTETLTQEYCKPWKTTLIKKENCTVYCINIF